MISSSIILIKIKKLLPIILLILAVIFLLIFLVRLIFSILLRRFRKTYKMLVKKADKIVNKKRYLKEEEELFRKKNKIPKANSVLKEEARAKKVKNYDREYEIISSPEEDLEQEEMNDVRIVDIVKPIGFWTSVILGQKLTYLVQSAQIINKRDKKGFWASMIEAQERVAGRQRGRSR
jgi:hypothetical protein